MSTIKNIESYYGKQCVLCEKDFPGKQSIKTHTSVIHESNTRYKCNECDDRFEDMNDLQCHINIIHLSD